MAEPVLDTSVADDLEAFLRKRGPCDISAEARMVSTITAVDRRTGMDVDPADLGDALVRSGLGDLAHGDDDLASPLTRGVTQQLAVTSGGPVDHGPRELLLGEHVRRVVGSVQ